MKKNSGVFYLFIVGVLLFILKGTKRGDLTRNFSITEFESNDGAFMPTDVFNNVQELAKNLQVLRDYLGKSITINSGYRSEEYNALIGGVPNSQHLLGKASDIKVSGYSPMEVKKHIEALIDKGLMEEGGIGVYSSFVHYDIRGTKARWFG